MTYLEFMNFLRTEEIRRVVALHRDLFIGKDLLEIGSGTGVQLRMLRQLCRSARGIEIVDRWYDPDPQVEIQEYDGRHIPFPDASFDIVFSSNVIEHIKDQQAIHREIRRVLRPDGVCVHVVPSATWRACATLAHYPAVVKRIIDHLLGLLRARMYGSGLQHREPVTLARWRTRLYVALFPWRHGEFGNWFSEYFLFTRRAWRGRFEAEGWRVGADSPVGLFHTGNCLLGDRLGLPARARLAETLGSSTTVFVLRQSRAAEALGTLRDFRSGWRF